MNVGQIVSKFESSKGRPPKYPWDLWANGKAWHLRRGNREEIDSGDKDFEAELISFRTMVHRKARDLDLGAKTHINRADHSIKVQFYNRED